MILLNIETANSPFIIGLTSGLVASLLASFIIWVFYRLLNDYFIPKYQEAIYNGVKIDGKWKNEIHNPNSKKGAEGFMKLNQSGTKLFGELNLKSIRGGQNPISISYDLKGEIVNDLVFLYGTPKDRHMKSFTAGLFTIVDGGKSLLGSSFGTDNYTSKIFAREGIHWIRD